MPWDSPLSSLEAVVTACAQLDEITEGTGHSLRMDSIMVAMPLELQTTLGDEGRLSIAVAPPRQTTMTSLMPVLHRLRLTVEVSR